jgi:hypothetical protein
MQSISQVSEKVQQVGPEGRLGSSVRNELVNQTAQGIWQLQIGCVAFCQETAQYQQAEQWNSTVQALIATPTSVSGTAASMANATAQLIWQVQIGCLFWCDDATQRQIASAHNTLVHLPAAPSSSESGSASPSGQAPSPVDQSAGSSGPPPVTASAATSGPSFGPALRATVGQPVAHGAVSRARFTQPVGEQGASAASPRLAARPQPISHDRTALGRVQGQGSALLGALDAPKHLASGGVSAVSLAAIAALAALVLGGLCLRYGSPLRDSRSPVA